MRENPMANAESCGHSPNGAPWACFPFRLFPVCRAGTLKFKFDPGWPKLLPNRWKLGGVAGLAVDKDDNVWVLNRPSPEHESR